MARAGTAKWSFLTLLFLLAVIAFGILAGRNLQSDSSQTPPPTPSSSVLPSIVEDLGSSSPTTLQSTSSQIDQLVIFNQSGSVGQLILLNPSTKDRKVLFTDKDDTLKIKQVGNLTSDGQEALVLMGTKDEDFGGSLWSISLDGSGKKTKLVDQFASPWPPVFSPDGKKIAYILFSNTETDGGFFLIIANRDGTNKRQLVRETAPIAQPVFSPKGDQIAYFRQEAPKGSSIVTVPILGGKTKTLVTYSDRVPYDLAWSTDGTMVFVDGTNTKAQLYQLSIQNELTTLTTPAGQEARPVFSPDGSALAFSMTGSSSIVEVYHFGTKKTDELGQGSIVMGWVTGRKV